MDAVTDSQNSRFVHIMRRIWNGPEQGTEKMSRMKSGKADSEPNHSNYASRKETYSQDVGRNVPQAPQQYQDQGDGGQESENFDGSPKSSTIISEGTVIVGDIKSDSDIEVYGSVTGGINTSGNIKINGKQNGDVQGSDISLSACTVRGSLSAAEDVDVDSESVIVGDIKCGNLTFDGKLKGNVHVMGNVNCKGNAIIIGDITSTTITVDSGAKLQGKVQISDGSIGQIDLPEDFVSETPEKK